MSEKKQDLIEKRKQIAFDLDTKAFQRYYPTPN